MRIVWYRSLPFKLFLFMTVFLAAAILSVSWQNSNTFRNLLEKQSEESTITTTRRAAAALSSGFAFWNSTVHSVMHAAASVDAVAERKFVESLVTSNRDVVSFQSFDVTAAETKERLFVFSQDVTNPGWRGTNARKNEEVIRKIGREFAFANKPIGKGIVSAENLFSALKIPIIQIRIPFVTRRGTEEIKSWAVLSFWASNLAVSLTRSDVISSAVVSAEGAVIFNQKGELLADLLAPLSSDLSKGLIDSPVGFRTIKGKTSEGSPVLSVASRIADVPFLVRLQKITRAEEQQVAFQIRKILLWAFILFLLTVLTSFVVATGITRRMKEVILATTHIASGDFKSRISVKSADEVGFLAYAVNSMAGAIQNLLVVRDNAVRQDIELKTAEAIQKTLVPREFGRDNYVNSFGFFRAATECAGDWWGRFNLGNGRSLVAIADATGHGASSAIIASIAYAFFASLEVNCETGKIQSNIDLAEVLTQLNSILWSSGQGACTMTMFVVLADSQKGVIQVASAAHTFPFLIRQGDRIKALGSGGSILGSTPNGEFFQQEMPMLAGDRIFMFTDGLVECTNSEGKQANRKYVKNMLSQAETLFGEEFFLESLKKTGIIAVPQNACHRVICKTIDAPVVTGLSAVEACSPVIVIFKPPYRINGRESATAPGRDIVVGSRIREIIPNAQGGSLLFPASHLIFHTQQSRAK